MSDGEGYYTQAAGNCQDKISVFLFLFLCGLVQQTLELLLRKLIHTVAELAGKLRSVLLRDELFQLGQGGVTLPFGDGLPGHAHFFSQLLLG